MMALPITISNKGLAVTISENGYGLPVVIMSGELPEPPVEEAPSVQTVPTISGGTTAADSWTLNIGTATGIPTPSSTRLWRVNDEVQDGQSGGTFSRPGLVEGDQIRGGVRWSNSAGEITVWSDPITITVQPAITATPPALTAGQQASITFNEAPDAVTVTQGGTVLPSQRAGDTNEWTFTPVTGQAVSITATKAGWTAYSAPDLPVDATWLAIPTQGGLTIHAMPTAQRLTGTGGTGSISITGTTAGGGTAPDLDGANVVLVTDGDWSEDEIIYATRETLPFLVAGLEDGEYIIVNTDANPTAITVTAVNPALPPDVFSTGASGTQLQAYVGASGETWTRIHDSGGNVSVNGAGRLHGGNGTGSAYIRGAADRGATQTAKAKVRLGSNTANVGIMVGARMQGNNGYFVAIDRTNGARLRRILNGTAATIGPIEAPGSGFSAEGDQPDVTIEVNGDQIRYAINDVWRAAVTDASLTGGGIGLRAATAGANGSSPEIISFDKGA